MSECGGILVACLAAPLLLIVLLAAGVAHVALQAANLVGHAALAGIEFAGRSLASSVQAASNAVKAAGDSLTIAANKAWADTLADSRQSVERFRGTALRSYERTSQMLLAAPRTLTFAADSLTRSTRTLGSSTALAPPAPHALSASRRAADALAKATAVRDALDSELPLRLLADRHFSGALTHANQLHEQACAAFTGGQFERANTLAAEAEGRLATTARDAHAVLVRSERAVLTAVVGNTLEEMRYDVRVATSRSGAAIVGRREDKTIALIVRAGGHIEIDMAGHDGESCSLEAQAFLRHLRSNGVGLAGVNLVHHGQFEGGALLRAAQQTGKPLAEALAEMAAPPQQAPTATKSVKTSARRTVRLESESDNARQNRARAWIWNQTRNHGGFTQ